MEQQEVPAGWWDAESDRSLLAGVYKHGGFSLDLCCMGKKRINLEILSSFLPRVKTNLTLLYQGMRCTLPCALILVSASWRESAGLMTKPSMLSNRRGMASWERSKSRTEV